MVFLCVFCAVTVIASPAQTLTTLVNFNGTDGWFPVNALVQGTDGNFYGTAGGGAQGLGTVFEITAGGELTTLYSFCAQTRCPDGELPSGGLVQATNGKFYGTTPEGGADGQGTVFEITPEGKLTTLHSFEYTDGSSPSGGLVQATNGRFYGTTQGGGTFGGGTVFEITAGGELTTLYSFCAETGCTDGQSPFASLIQATNGKFQGTTSVGGANNQGTVFEITAGGELTTLHSFVGTDGALPEAVLTQATNGKFYGTTSEGGEASTTCPGGSGTVFSLSVGLGPFVETRPTSGRVGETVIILGNDLTGATRVTFNRADARFKVVSSSEIEATVPPDATTGKVEVTTPSGTLTSNVDFRVSGW
jgi:uncharacterized repeat protein (TIGR03803 family)